MKKFIVFLALFMTLASAAIKEFDEKFSRIANPVEEEAKELALARNEAQINKTLFRKKRFALNEMFQQNASKFAIFYV